MQMITKMHKRRSGFTLIEMSIVLLIIGILASIAVPACMKCRESSRSRVCLTHLRHLQDAKDRWALDNRKTNTDTPTFDDLIPNYLKLKPECPGGGTYELNSIGESVTCSTPGHSLY